MNSSGLSLTLKTRLATVDDAFELGFPCNDVYRLEDFAKGIPEHSGGILDGNVLTIDGFGVRTHCP